MITIIHGSDIVTSRKFFFEQKNNFPEANILDGEKITITDLTQVFDGGGLFAEEKTVFIEHLFNRKKKKTEFQSISEYLHTKTTHNIILWEGKELDKGALTVFKTTLPRVFKLPQTLFMLLDNLKPDNSKQLITLFHQTLATTDPEMIFFMLVRQVRLLLALSPSQANYHTDHVIDELKRLAPWQKTKLQQQAALFTKDQLLILYDKLFAIESGQKTGTLPNTILTSIDFFLLEI